MTTELQALASWDSMSTLLYMSLVEENFHREVIPDDIAVAQTIGDLYELANGRPVPQKA
jgi:acyl carrier protein